MTDHILFGPELDSGLSYRIPVLHVAGDGAQFAFCEARQGAGGDWDPSFLQMRRKRPGGEWERPVNLCCNPNGPAHNPAPFEVDGDLHLLYLTDYARCFHVFSRDGGDSFSPPEDITYVFEAFRAPDVDWHCIAVGPGGVARLDDGRIVAPVWLGGLEEPRRHNPAKTASIYSDDGGRTWRAGEIVAISELGPSEAQIAPVPGGALISLRNNGPRRRRAFAFSPDGARWEAPELARDVVEINCQGSLLRRGERLYISGPEPQGAPGEDGRMVYERERLTLRASSDYGRSWGGGVVLVPGTAGYSALATSAQGELLCLYETWESWQKMRLILLTLREDELPG